MGNVRLSWLFTKYVPATTKHAKVLKVCISHLEPERTLVQNGTRAASSISKGDKSNNATNLSSESICSGIHSTASFYCGISQIKVALQQCYLLECICIDVDMCTCLYAPNKHNKRVDIFMCFFSVINSKDHASTNDGYVYFHLYIYRDNIPLKYSSVHGFKVSDTCVMLCFR